MFDLSGRTAIVTGGGRGLGRAHAMFLAKRGCAVIVNDLGTSNEGDGADRSPADEVVETIRQNGGKAAASYGSVARQEDVLATAELAVTEFGGIDIVVNNAGFEMVVEFGELDFEKVRHLFDVHVFGAMMMAQAAWPHLIKSGSGRVINTVSNALLGFSQRSAYGAAKGALLGFTRNLAVDGEKFGIKANAIAPGAGTRMVDAAKLSDKLREFMIRHNPPELVSPAVGYLAHPDCAVNGEIFAVSGGKIARFTTSVGTGISPTELTPEIIADNLDKLLDPADLQVVTRVHFPQDD